MQQSKVLETWVGLFVVLGIVSLFFLAMKVSNLADLHVKDDSYRLFARFQNVGSLRERAPVSMAGVRIGRVSSIRFDNKTYDAVVEMRIEPQFNTIPTDTTANILTAGLLGEQYIGLSAGAEEEYFKDGEEIELSQSAMVLEEVISRFLFNKAEGGSEKKDSPQADTTEEKTGQEPPAVKDVQPKSETKTQDKAVINKHSPASPPSKSEKGKTEPVHKPIAAHAKHSENTHSEHKTKGASVKDEEDIDADHKKKPGAR